MSQKTLIITENQKRTLAINNAVEQAMNEVNDKFFNDIGQWFDNYRGEDGKIDIDKIAEECIQLLKQTSPDELSDFSYGKSEKIKLPNGCTLWYRMEDRKNNECDMWEITMPGGEAFDGEVVDEDIDYEMQELLYNKTHYMSSSISEQTIGRLISEAIADYMNRSIFESKQFNSAAIRTVKGELANHIADLIAQGDPTIQKIAHNIGINLNYNKAERAQMAQSLIASDGNLSSEISDEVLDVAEKLKPFVGKGGHINFDGLRDTYPADFDNIMRIKDFIDQIGMTHLYDPSFIRSAEKRRSLDGKYGVTVDKEGNIDTSGFNFNSYTDDDVQKYLKGGMKKGSDGSQQLPAWAKGKSDDEIASYVIAKKQQGILSQYLASKYGLALSIPGTMFVAGNNKLPTSTLIVNFTSAQRCPAWNECLVKHACYARGIEHFRQGARDSNTQKNLMWAMGETDPTMLNLLFDMVKAYIFNYRNAAKVLKINEDGLRKTDLDSMDDETANILAQYKRITDIRLNENGDFIAAWLVKAWDKFAGSLRKFGVNTACYTCRNLNLKGIENIIMNASTTSVKSDGVNRYFFAVTEDMYNAFDETYSGPENALQFTKDADGHTKIIPNIQPLYDNDGKPNGNYYYKCPCNRTDGLGDNPEGKVNCYQCRICYEPSIIKDENGKMKPYYVFVKVHGSAKNDFVGRMATFGVSKNYWQRMAKINPDIKQGMVAESISDAMKGFNTFMSSPMMGGLRSLVDFVKSVFGKKTGFYKKKAVGQISKNAINSVNDHLKQIK